MSALRWGLLGTARINRRLIPAMRATRRSVVAAVASRTASRAQIYAAEWAIPVAHPSYESLLHDPGIDAVYVPLPNALHVEWTLRALDAGKHVLCEKPLALNAEDVDRVESLARARQRIVAEAFMYRHEPMTAQLVALIGSQAIGPLSAISTGFTFTLQRPNDVRLDPALGGGSLWDIGCYAVGLARLAAGAEPAEVFGVGMPSATGVDESFTGILRFPGDLVATVHSSFLSPYRSWFEATGTKGWLRVETPFKPSPGDIITVTVGDEVRRIVVDGSALLFVRMVEDFVAATMDGRPQAVPLAESRGNAATLTALYRAAETGRPIPLGQ